MNAKSLPIGEKTRPPLPLDEIYHLHRSIGNRAVQGLFRTGMVRVQTDKNRPLHEPLRLKPFPGETPELEKRRKDAIKGAENAITHIERGLRSGYLWSHEKLKGKGIECKICAISGESTTVETIKSRNARLVKLTDDLWKLVARLQRGPIPKKWLAPVVVFKEGGRLGSTADVDMFYAHRMHRRGKGHFEIWRNILYIDDIPIAKQKIKLRRRDLPYEGDIQLGIWLVVKDPVNRPQEWKRLSGFEPIDGHIVELSQDRRGYFYYWYGKKKYLPKYPKQ